jgi:hypothetical protein
MNKNQQPCVDGLFNWIQNSPVGANYKFMFMAEFTYAFGLK